MGLNISYLYGKQSEPNIHGITVIVRVFKRVKSINKGGTKGAAFKIADTVNYFTASLNFLPAEKAGTVFAAILIVAPV